ncbi:response regulator transcription factor [Paenibacillus arenilitoris]|uniref:Response regulator transcription factor n=1 Tax=Paenibacillus arenilitoris TaxID=2772299 RepID=A0A927CT97_9BACL|nr:response regulator transcription factor [Paenibacillus arenilitoris]MBD2872513.1 response regulator transcription factor [Paenibacillus arenilitoris]
MNKVLIVDDEPMIREGLQSIVDWGKRGFLVAGTASNGREAVEKHKELRPDLILIDIRMPGMDGLQAIEEIRKTDTVCRILILSGYADFNYAKQAIAHSVDGYILKPIDEDELDAYVERIGEQLKLSSAKQESTEQTTALLREELLQQLASGKPSAAYADGEELKRLLGTPAKYYQLLLIELYSREHSLTMNATVRKKLADLVEQKQIGWVFSAEPFVGVLLKDYLLQNGSREEMRQWIEESCGERIRFTAAASMPVRELRELEDWTGAVRGLLKRRFMQSGRQIHIASIEEAANPIEERPSEPDMNALAEKLFYMLDIGSKDGVEKTLQEASDRICAHDSSEQSVKSGWAQLLTIVLNKAATSNPQLSLQEDLNMVTALYLAHHYDEMLAQLRERLSELAAKIGKSDNSSVMKKMTDFIERHYSENIKLETLAELFNYNSGYLGKMFKNHTGEHFNTYLDRVRIQHAIELLQEGLKVHQVSERVGYANVDYFHSKFKKYKGVSPSSFKGAGGKGATE